VIKFDYETFIYTFFLAAGVFDAAFGAELLSKTIGV
jgi:hypothetical protein